MVTLILIMYMCAIVFVEGIAAHLLATPAAEITDELQASVRDHWSSMPAAILTEYETITGGRPWATVLEPIKAAGGFYHFLFLVYIALLVIAVLRLLTGIFVHHAAMASSRDQESSIEQNLIDLFQQVDQDGSGYITAEEFRVHIKGKIARKCLIALGINPADAEKLFKVLDTSGDGQVDIQEFIHGCKQFRGPSKNIDMAVAIRRLNKLTAHVKLFMEYVEERFDAQSTGPMNTQQKIERIGERLKRATSSEIEQGLSCEVSLSRNSRLV